MIASIVKFQGSLKFDADRPDGTPRKLLDVSRINSLGWKHEIALRDGLVEAYQWYVENHKY
jgi:GDP-L-fucose synthase